jgi:hypothetical protein
MKLSDMPSETFPIPFANAAGIGYTRQVPVASQIGITNGAASLTDGFPPLTFLPVGSGGIPPFGQDFNGLLNQITQWTQWQNAGGLMVYNSAFSTAIGGYPQSAVVASATTAGIVWLNTVDNNTTNPDASGAGWVKFVTSATLVASPTRVLTLTSTTTLTVQSGETRADVEVWAGGGAGGGGSAVSYGGGGGGGEYRQGLITGLTTGQTIVATVGAGGAGGAGGGGNGGTSSFGSYITAIGGFGAPYASSGAGGAALGGSGGSGGTFNVSGMAGEGIFNTGSTTAAIIGLGGASWGCGHAHFVNFIFGNNATGSSGLFPGQGGSGASGAGLAGSGANGLIIVKFYP